MTRLLIAGGSRDPNLSWLRDTAHRLNVPCDCLLIEPGKLPALVWHLQEGTIEVDGKRLDCTAAFLRYDVFTDQSGRNLRAAETASAWFATFAGYCTVAGLFTLNRALDVASASKPAMLAMAHRHGFHIPPTTITNSATHLRGLGAPESFIAKPVQGGSYIMQLDEAIREAAWEVDVAPSPALVQPKLAYPELRLYRVGTRYFGFDIGSTTLDSRMDRGQAIRPLSPEQMPTVLVESLRRMTDELRCDFCSIDLKTDPATGGLVFLELNNGPMFMGYDATANGAMADAMVRYLASRGNES